MSLSYLSPYISKIDLIEKSIIVLNKKVIVLNKKANIYLSDYLNNNSINASSQKLINYLTDNKVFITEKMNTIPKPNKMNTPLTLAVTSKCNLGCLYCYADANKFTKTITKDVYETAIDNFLNEIFTISKDASLILHGGGEPTIDSKVFKNIVEYFIKRCEISWLTPKITFITNGTFNSEIKELLTNTKEIKSLSLSLDGIEKVQNLQRPYVGGKDSFQTVMKNVKFLKSIDKKITIMSVVTKNSIEYMVDTILMAKEYGIDGVKFDPMYDSERSLRKGLNEVDLKEFGDALLKSYKKGIELGVEVSSSFLTVLSKPSNKGCGTINGMHVITPEGNITSCYEVLEEIDDAFDTFAIGKVQKGKNILFDDKLEYLTSRTSDKISDCDECFLKYTCAGACAVQSFRKNKDIYSMLKEECAVKRDVNKKLIEYIYENKSKFKDLYEIKEFNF